METVSDDWQTPLDLAGLQAQLDQGDELRTRPELGNWGYFLRVSPELGYFSWFASRNAMLRYLVQVEILHAPTALPDRLAYDQWQARIQPIASRYAQDGDADAACEALNACFPDFQLEWLGAFQELIESPHPFARGLRTVFAQPLDPRALDDKVLDDKTLAAFADFIEDYGI
ncbi:MAG: hypothetical protein CVV27_09865 [Candidatus Melainabacteria bacterium HGW-Melainabacteria-1]|nr:MAG: hypothetical protein CVV27_09865 [Candidatus Melainabacteria bacterium HGW-Melainabacteria-1]